jgi:hypothetical protein
MHTTLHHHSLVAGWLVSCCVLVLLLQVADNGKGVPPEDHAALALKYHTSKISQFQDLEVTPAAELSIFHI